MKTFKVAAALALISSNTSAEEEIPAVLEGEEAKNYIFQGSNKRTMNTVGGLGAFGFNMEALNYGCHCAAIVNGHQAGLGAPVDPLDSVCKDYLGCIRCVKKQTRCEKIDTYHFLVNPEMQVSCMDPSNTCSRSSCECDGKLFADIWHLATVGMDYDFKFAGSNFDRNKNCRKMDMTRGTFIQQLKAQYDTQCCGGNEYPMEHFNVLKYQCCDRGDGNKVLKKRC